MQSFCGFLWNNMKNIQKMSKEEKLSNEEILTWQLLKKNNLCIFFSLLDVYSKINKNKIKLTLLHKHQDLFQLLQQKSRLLQKTSLAISPIRRQSERSSARNVNYFFLLYRGRNLKNCRWITLQGLFNHHFITLFPPHMWPTSKI